MNQTRLPSDVMEDGLRAYNASSILPLNGREMFIRDPRTGQYGVSPFGAIAAGLGWRHFHNAPEVIAETSGYLAEWDGLLADSLIDEIQRRGKWNGVIYPFETLLEWLRDRELATGAREMEGA